MRALLILLAACAPDIAGPVEHQRAVDREDALVLAKQLGDLPGAIRAEVALHRPVTDPLAQKTTPGSAAVVIVVDDKADRAAIEASARTLVHATAPDIATPEIAVALGGERQELARVGPFTVAARHKNALQATLAAALAIIAGLALWIARRTYQPRGNSAQ